MPLSIPRDFVDDLLLGPIGDRRQLQQTPILGDVWIAFAKEPDKPQQLLITPDWRNSAGEVANQLDDLVEKSRGEVAGKSPGKKSAEYPETDIASLQGIIAARLLFREIVHVVMPITTWRHNLGKIDEIDSATEKAGTALAAIIKYWRADRAARRRPERQQVGPFERLILLAGLILWAGGVTAKEKSPSEQAIAKRMQDDLDAIKRRIKEVEEEFRPVPERALVYEVSLNRTATTAIAKSVPSIKADAARKLFEVNCSDIAWAVLDSGIQGNHPAFCVRNEKGECVTLENGENASRIRHSFDFRHFRKIVSRDNFRLFHPDAKKDNERRKEVLKLLANERLEDETLKKRPDDAAKALFELASDLRDNRPIDWAKVTPFIKIKIDTPPPSDHGSHVAGIIGAGDSEHGKGVCPDIRLYDFRVLSEDIEGTEFAIIAALQFIRYLNTRSEAMEIFGANLSLSIPHDVRNFACGRTPICVECEKLVESGVVVVAAAGNLGYQRFQTKDGSYEGYAAFSITDPGNADGVITVGSTHRTSPHTYGVSFFSSRGPTGDGRLKPDIVAPGEKINAPIGSSGWGGLDGTSMAAPHVSGAAALLMARYSELIGQPRRVKEILCKSATDLGRERTFQGHGMLDVLRAFQSI